MKLTLGIFAVAVLSSLLFISCESATYKNYEDVVDFQWKKSDVKKYSVEIKETGTDYSVIIALRHYTQTPLNEVDVAYTIETPSGDKTEGKAKIQVKDPETGQLVGEAAYQFTDVEAVVIKDWKPESSGTYKFSVQSDMSQDPVPTIMEVGLIVRNNKAE
ncbi:MAG: hypothetical protein AAF740_08135 [Bacteroidota bacterium]